MADNIQELEAEFVSMKEAVVAAVGTWADLENSLAHILEVAINTPNPDMAYAIYYAPSNTESRIEIVDNVIHHLSARHDDVSRVKKCWERLRYLIDKSKRTRNKIVHGQICAISLRGKSYCRLTDPVFDRTKRNATREVIDAGQIPGLSPNDVKIASETFSSRSEAAVTLMEILTFIYRGAPTPDPATWQPILLQLEADLNLTGTHTSGPTPTGP